MYPSWLGSLIALGLAVVVLLLVPLAPAAAQTASELVLEPPAGALPVSTATVDVRVRVSGAVDLTAFEFDLSYDPDLVTVTGISLEPFLGDPSLDCDPDAGRCAAPLGPVAQGTGVVSLGGYAFGAAAPPSGDALLAVIHLQPTGQPGTLNLELSQALVTDAAATPSTPGTQGTTIQLTQAVYLPLLLRSAP